MKTAISSSGVSVSGSVGGQKGTVGVGSNGTVNFGIDYAGVKLGVTNDYGGAGTIGFGGQSITWGITGGNIKLGIGGFEVKVEARDCVVVETKKIAGMIVSQRSYPDPGCKIPPNTLPSIPDGKGLGYSPDKIPGLRRECVYHFLILIKNWRNERWGFRRGGGIYGSDIWDKTVFTEGVGTAYIANVIPHPDYPKLYTIVIKGEGREEPYGASMSFVYTENYGYFAHYDPKSYHRTETFEHRGNVCNPAEFTRLMNTWYKPRYPNSNFTVVAVPLSCDGIPSPPYSAPAVSINFFSPSAGNRPPMPESCCESLKADIEDIKQVLATKEMLAKKLTFPWRLRMPGGEGDEVITDYPNLARCLAQMIDHLGIHPPKLSIKDINNAVAGDQSIENQFPSGTQAFEALMAQVWDANADVDTLTNFLYRLSWLCVQQSMNLARVSGDIQCIKDMFGGETEPQESSITTPFNIGAGVEEKPAPTKGKGFGKSPGGNIDKSIEANTELSTEKLLPDFLKIRENPVIVQTFTGNKDVFDLLSIIILKLEGLQNR